jgi:hypothetical protein
MADKFRLGQKVRLIKAMFNKQDIGKILIIESKKVKYNFNPIGIFPGYKVSGGSGLYDHAPESWLEPVYDGDEKSSWSECAWKPSWIKSHG